MTTIVNTDNEEVRDNLLIFEKMCIIEITHYTLDEINKLPLPFYEELAKYCSMRVNERRATAKALGVNVKEIF